MNRYLPSLDAEEGAVVGSVTALHLCVMHVGGFKGSECAWKLCTLGGADVRLATTGSKENILHLAVRYGPLESVRSDKGLRAYVQMAHLLFPH